MSTTQRSSFLSTSAPSGGTLAGGGAATRGAGGPSPGFEVFVGDENPHLGPKHHFTLIGAVDINGFVSAACGRVRRKRRPNDTDPTRGTVDQERFYEYVVGTLVPTLGSYANGEPRSVVVMDNATVHKDPRVRVAIEAAGAVLIWNAAYSPECGVLPRHI